MHKQLLSFCAYLVVAGVYPGAHAAIKAESRGLLDARLNEGTVRYQIKKLDKQQILLAKQSTPEEFQALITSRRDKLWENMPAPEVPKAAAAAGDDGDDRDGMAWTSMEEGSEKYQVPPFFSSFFFLLSVSFLLCH